jgi:Fungal specific transcription factor domain
VPKHPPAKHINQLWRAFLQNVNPLTKLVHVPSLQTAIEKAITNIERIPKGFEALMFAIYSIAVLSLTDEECKDTLGESRATLLPHYVGATRTALTRAGFMSSTSVVTLQALVIHILSIRDVFEPRAVWSLTGVAIRIAEGMGMRLDGTLLGLSPFETEIRRRIWWQLQMHDFRAAELSGQAKFRNFELDETTPKKPANVNDTELYPAMPQAAIDSVRPTEMIYCRLRSDLASFAAAQKAKMTKLGKTNVTSEDFSAMDDLRLKDIFIKELEDLLETKYLRFCDPSQPLQLLTLLGARLSTNLIRFIAHHPRRWDKLEQVPVSEQRFIWGIAMGLLEQYDMMQSSPQLRRFAWCVPYFIQWHAVIHVLDTLRASPLHLDAANAWRLIDALYQNNPQMLMSIKKPIFVAVGNLCLGAFDARSAALESQGRTLPKQPEYITKLQEVRKAARTRREAVIAKRQEQKTLEAERRLLAVNLDAMPLDANSKSTQPVVDAPLAYTTANQPTYPITRNLHTEDDAFWLSNALNDDFLGEAGSMMDLDMDAVLGQDYWLENPNGEGIDWVQWDALVSNVDPRT